jgi:hypothetical protein
MSDTKAYQVVFEDRPNYLYARLEAGGTDKRLAAVYLREIIDTCRESKHDRILIECNIAGPISTSLVFLQTGFLEKIAEGLKIAIVDGDEQHHLHLERGIRYLGSEAVNVRPFQSKDDAEAWLAEDQIDPS